MKQRCSPAAECCAADACLLAESRAATAVLKAAGSNSISVQSRWNAVGRWPELYWSAGRQSTKKNFT